MSEYTLLSFLFLFIFFISWLFLKLNQKIASLFNLFDNPDNIRKSQLKRVPLTGGIYFYCVFFILFIFSKIFLDYDNNLISLNQFYFITLIFLIGLADDRLDINANIKIILVYLLFLIYLFFDQLSILNILHINELNLSLNIMSMGYFFTALCLLIFLNASNMFDGIDGQTGGYFLFLLLYLQYLNEFSLFLFLFSITMLFFLVFNLYQRWYLGDSGVYLISFFVSIIIIKNYHLENLYVEQIFLLMMVPGLDLIRLFFERIKKGRHPFSADTRHLHHILLIRFDKKNALKISLSLVILPNIFAVYFDKFFIFILITLIVYIYLIFFSHKKISRWI